MRDRFFYHILARIKDYVSYSPLSMAFYSGKTRKMLPENSEFADMRHGDVIITYNHVTDRRAANVRLIVFYLFHGVRMGM